MYGIRQSSTRERRLSRSDKSAILAIVCIAINAFAMSRARADEIEATSAMLLAQARELERRDSLDPAIVQYQKVFESYPESPEAPIAILAVADLHSRMAHHVEAERLFWRLISEYPADARVDEARFRLGWSCQTRNASATAADQWEVIHSDFPASRFWPEATYLLAEYAFNTGDRSSARRITEDWLVRTNWRKISDSRSPESTVDDESSPRAADALAARVLFLDARIAISEERWNDARKSLELLLTSRPDSPLRLATMFWIAEMSYRLRDYDVAERQFAQLELLALGQEESWIAMIPLRRAQIMAVRDEWKTAYAVASEIATRFPGFPLQYEADYVIGRCHAIHGEMESAREAYRRVADSSAASASETAAMAQWMIGETFLHQRNFNDALIEFSRVEQFQAYDEWRARAAHQSGVCLERMGRWADAKRHYERATEIYANTSSGDRIAERLKAVTTRAR